MRLFKALSSVIYVTVTTVVDFPVLIYDFFKLCYKENKFPWEYNDGLELMDKLDEQ